MKELKELEYQVKVFKYTYYFFMILLLVCLAIISYAIIKYN